MTIFVFFKVIPDEKTESNGALQIDHQEEENTTNFSCDKIQSNGCAVDIPNSNNHKDEEKHLKKQKKRKRDRIDDEIEDSKSKKKQAKKEKLNEIENNETESKEISEKSRKKKCKERATENDLSPTNEGVIQI